MSTLSSLNQLLQETRDSIQPLVDLRHAGGEAEADVGFEAAVVAGDDCHVRVLQQRRSETDGVCYLCAADRSSEIGADVGETIERALRADAGDLGKCGQS